MGVPSPPRAFKNAKNIRAERTGANPEEREKEEGKKTGNEETNFTGQTEKPLLSQDSELPVVGKESIPSQAIQLALFIGILSIL